MSLSAWEDGAVQGEEAVRLRAVCYQRRVRKNSRRYHAWVLRECWRIRGELYLVPIGLHFEGAFTNSLPLEHGSGMPWVYSCSSGRDSRNGNMIHEAWKLTKRV